MAGADGLAFVLDVNITYSVVQISVKLSVNYKQTSVILDVVQYCSWKKFCTDSSSLDLFFHFFFLEGTPYYCIYKLNSLNMEVALGCFSSWYRSKEIFHNVHLILLYMFYIFYKCFHNSHIQIFIQT